MTSDVRGLGGLLGSSAAIFVRETYLQLPVRCYFRRCFALQLGSAGVAGSLPRRLTSSACEGRPLRAPPPRRGVRKMGGRASEVEGPLLTAEDLHSVCGRDWAAIGPIYPIRSSSASSRGRRTPWHRQPGHKQGEQRRVGIRLAPRMPPKGTVTYRRCGSRSRCQAPSDSAEIRVYGLSDSTEVCPL
jgi:hypothetical protein